MPGMTNTNEAPRRVRLLEPLGGICKDKLVIVPGDLEGVTAPAMDDEHEGTFAVIIDAPGNPYDMARCGDVMEEQVEDVGPDYDDVIAYAKSRGWDPYLPSGEYDPAVIERAHTELAQRR